MSTDQGWLERLSLRDLYDFTGRNLGRLFPRITSRVNRASGNDSGFSQTDIRAGEFSQRDHYFQSLLAVFGASVLFVSAPLIYSYVWRQFRSSRYFSKKPSEFENMGVVITGCDSGIGLETAAFLSELYPDLLVFAGCLTKNGIMRLSQLHRDNLVTAKVDITIDSEISAFVNFVRARLVQRKLYAVINNAGIYGGSFFEVTSTQIYSNVITTNFLGAVQVTKAFLPLMQKSDTPKIDGSRIINISSLAAALPSSGNTAYCASKAALTAFNHGLRQELSEIGIKVILVVPGPLRTASLGQIPITASSLLIHGPEEVVQRYGGRAFIHAYSRFFEELHEQADPPARIARIIQKILTRRYPKDVYYEDGLFYNILGICPHSFRDFLMDPQSFRKQIMSKYPLP